MTKSVSILVALVMVFSLTACKASPSDTKKADDFMAGLAFLKSADPVSTLEKLADSSAAVLNLPGKAFDLQKDWSLKEGHYDRYIYIFNSDATLSIELWADKVDKVSYTFCVKTPKDMYYSADNLIGKIGAPLGVYLNGAPSSHSAVDSATDSGSDPKLTYSYVWKTQLREQSFYVYEAYYDASGVNFTYVVVANNLDVGNLPQINLWK